MIGRKKKIKNQKGLTLVEVLVAAFIFSLVMITVTVIFSNFVIAKKKARSTQLNLDDARYAMDLMSKTIRTSSVEDSSGSSINIYDYSQDLCLSYFFDSATGKIKSGYVSPGRAGEKSSCDFSGITARPIVNSTITHMNFLVDQTVPGPGPGAKAGKVTISVEVCSPSGCNFDKVDLQTTVTLRNYIEVAGGGSSYACSGTPPSNADMCLGDGAGLTANAAWTAVITCGAPKCEYQCYLGYVPNADQTDCELGPQPPTCCIFDSSNFDDCVFCD